MDGRLYEVIIEWNGKQPPTKWYRYLEKLTGMSVRKNGTDSLNIISDRMNAGDYGVIIQEGCIRCGSYSLARTIYFLAKAGLWVDTKDGPELIKPAAVILAEVSDLSVEMTPADEEALALMNVTFSHRGRQVGDPIMWTVSCFEDLASYETESHSVINCPHCGGLHMRARPGERLYLADPGGPIEWAWMRTRFATGIWEVPRKGNAVPPGKVDIKDEREKEVVGLVVNSLELKEILDCMDREEAMRVLDAAFVARAYWSEDRRIKARVEAYMEFSLLFKERHDKARMYEDSRSVDIFTAAGPIGPEWAASKLFQHIIKTEPGNKQTVEPQVTEMKKPDKPVLSIVSTGRQA